MSGCQIDLKPSGICKRRRYFDIWVPVVLFLLLLNITATWILLNKRIDALTETVKEHRLLTDDIGALVTTHTEVFEIFDKKLEAFNRYVIPGWEWNLEKRK